MRPGEATTAADDDAHRDSLRVAATGDPDVARMLLVKGDDKRAFQQLYESYKRPMVRYCRRYLRHDARAEDAAQEVFLRLYRARASYEPLTPFRSFIYRIATNVCLNAVRTRDWKQSRENSSDDQVQALADTGSYAGAQAQLEGARLQQALLAAIDTLPENQKTALLLLRFEDLSYEEIAASMQLSVSAIKALLNRARAQLLHKLSPHLDTASGSNVELPSSKKEHVPC